FQPFKNGENRHPRADAGGPGTGRAAAAGHWWSTPAKPPVEDRIELMNYHKTGGANGWAEFAVTVHVSFAQPRVIGPTTDEAQRHVDAALQPAIAQIRESQTYAEWRRVRTAEARAAAESGRQALADAEAAHKAACTAGACAASAWKKVERARSERAGAEQ